MENYKEYIIMIIFFVAGIFLGVFFINQAKETQKTEIQQYLGEFVNDLKSIDNINQV